MALTFPLERDDFQRTLRVKAGPPFKIRRSEEVAATAEDYWTAEIGWPRWEATMLLAPMYFAEAARVLALLEEIGTNNSVELYDPSKKLPAADPTGNIVGTRTLSVSAIGSDNRSMRISGLPPAYVITAGDMVSIAYGSARRYLGRVTATVTANSVGVTPTFGVIPPLPAGAEAGRDAVVRRAFGYFRIVSFDPGSNAGLTNEGMSFSAIQVPR